MKYLLLFLPFFTSCQNIQNFNFKLLDDSNNKLEDSTKTYLKYYFDEVNFLDAQNGILINKCPKKDTTYLAKLKSALNPKSYSKHLKLINIERSDKNFEVIDTTYYQSIPYNSLIKLSKEYYEHQESIFKMQMHNATDIDEVVELMYPPKDFLPIKGNYVGLRIGIKNMSNKEIKEAYGTLTVEDNYGNIIISANYGFTGKIYEPLSQMEFEQVLNLEHWVDWFEISKQESLSVINRIKEIGEQNLIIKFKPTRVNFSDGTQLIR